MFNLLRNVKYLTEKKVRNPFFATYFFVLLYRNWALIFTLFNFDDDCRLADKFYLIHKHFENKDLICEIWTNLWITALVILVSYLLFFGFRALANLFERRVFPIADKIDNDLLVTKDRHLKVKEDRDNLNKELEYVRDENIKLDKNYAKIKKELGDHEQWLTENQKELNELKNQKKDLDTKYKAKEQREMKLSTDVNKLINDQKFLIFNIKNELVLTLKALQVDGKIDLFLGEFIHNYINISREDLNYFIRHHLIESTSSNSDIKLTMKGNVLNYYSTQKIKKGSKKLSLTQVIENYVDKGYLETTY